MSSKTTDILSEIFVYGDQPLGVLSLFNQAEDTSYRSTHDHPSLAAYNLLSHAMMCFYLQTMKLYGALAGHTSQQWHQVVVAKISWEFLSLRAAEKVARDGYPWQAVPMLRNVHDRLVMLSACLQEPQDFPRAMGTAGGNSCPDRAKRMRKKYERETAVRMMGSESGLSKECQGYLQKIDLSYDEETHPAFLSFAHRIAEWRSGGGLPVVPEFDSVGFAVFMSRQCEVFWMTHRVLPAIQPRGNSLPDEWKVKWRAIDAACQEVVGAMKTPGGEDVGSLIIEFVNKKFPFNANSVCETS